MEDAAAENDPLEDPCDEASEREEVVSNRDPDSHPQGLMHKASIASETIRSFRSNEVRGRGSNRDESNPNHSMRNHLKQKLGLEVGYKMMCSHFPAQYPGC